MFSHPKILFLVSLLFVALLNPKFNPYLLFKFLIFYHSSIYTYIFIVFCVGGSKHYFHYHSGLIYLYIYCILRGWIKGFNSAVYAIKCQEVVIELWLGSYSTVVG